MQGAGSPRSQRGEAWVGAVKEFRRVYCYPPFGNTENLVLLVVDYEEEGYRAEKKRLQAIESIPYLGYMVLPVFRTMRF